MKLAGVHLSLLKRFLKPNYPGRPMQLNLYQRRCLPLVMGLAVILSSGTSAQQTATTGDHPLLAGFPESRVVDYNFERDVNYRLVLGNLRRVGGRVVPEEAQRMRGNLTRLTYEISDGYSGNDVYRFFREQAESRGYSELFSCTGRACGNSNHWANEVFDNRSLYGPERNQFYLALGLGRSEQPASYAAVYIITRANRRLLAHVEILEDSTREIPQTVRVAGAQLQTSGALQIPELEFDRSDRLVADAGLDQIARLLEENEALRVYVVAHLQGQDSLERLLERSQARAEEVRSALIARGIDEQRLIARGVGPLSPLCSTDNCAERIELVLQ